MSATDHIKEIARTAWVEGCCVPECAIEETPFDTVVWPRLVEECGESIAALAGVKPSDLDDYVPRSELVEAVGRGDRLCAQVWRLANGELLKPVEGWSMPEPPSPGLVAFAYLVGGGDGWELYWGSPDEPSETVSEIAWPFSDEAYAVRVDFDSLLFHDPEMYGEG